MVSDEIIINQFLIGQPEDKSFVSATNYRIFLDDIANIEIIIGGPILFMNSFFLSYEDAVNEIQ